MQSSSAFHCGLALRQDFKSHGAEHLVVDAVKTWHRTGGIAFM